MIKGVLEYVTLVAPRLSVIRATRQLLLEPIAILLPNCRMIVTKPRD